MQMDSFEPSKIFFRSILLGSAPVILHWAYQNYKNILDIIILPIALCGGAYFLFASTRKGWKPGYTFHLFGVDISAFTKIVDKKIYGERFLSHLAQFSAAFLGIFIGSYWSNHFFPTPFSPILFVWWAFGYGIYSIKLPQEEA